MHQHELLDEASLMADTRFWEIYDSSFPPSETEPHEVIRCAVNQGSGLAFRTIYEGRTVCMASCQVLQEVSALFLVYVAVEPLVQCLGLGGSLLEYIFRTTQERIPGLAGFVWEVDRIEDAAEPDEVKRRISRIRFFERHRGQIIDPTYLQPALDGTHTVPMNLMFRATVGLPPKDPSSLAKSLTRSIYYEKYGAVNGLPKAHLDELLAQRA